MNIGPFLLTIIPLLITSNFIAQTSQKTNQQKIDELKQELATLKSTKEAAQKELSNFIIKPIKLLETPTKTNITIMNDYATKIVALKERITKETNADKQKQLIPQIIQIINNATTGLCAYLSTICSALKMLVADSSVQKIPETSSAKKKIHVCQDNLETIIDLTEKLAKKINLLNSVVAPIAQQMDVGTVQEKGIKGLIAFLSAGPKIEKKEKPSPELIALEEQVEREKLNLPQFAKILEQPIKTMSESIELIIKKFISSSDEIIANLKRQISLINAAQFDQTLEPLIEIAKQLDITCNRLMGELQSFFDTILQEADTNRMEFTAFNNEILKALKTLKNALEEAEFLQK